MRNRYILLWHDDVIMIGQFYYILDSFFNLTRVLVMHLLKIIIFYYINFSLYSVIDTFRWIKV